MDWRQRLVDAGFRPVGVWRFSGGSLVCDLNSYGSHSDVLYAFVSGDEVLYIGKTTMPLSKRMYGYQNPGPTQRTNIANNANLRDLLSEGGRVEIYALIDTLRLEHAGFRVSLAAGLENSLIAAIKPPWNKSGR